MRTVGAVLLLLCAATAALADLKVTRRVGAGGRSSETTVYVKGSRQRTETPALTTIEQCDLRRTIQISERSHKYVIIPDQPAEGEATPAPTAPQTSRPTRRGGVVTHTVTITDTGERKQMFGFNARHIKTATVMDAPQGTCSPGHMEMEADGWYIDMPAGFSCDVTRAPSPPPTRGGRPDCQDQVRTKLVGTARLGLPVSMTTRMKTGGEEDAEASAAMAGAMTMTLEVTDISNVTLDPALFEVPAGYTEVASVQELFGAPSSAEMMRQAMAGNRTEGADEGAERGGMSTPSAMSNAAAAVQPKRPGVVRVGVVPINNRSGREVSAESMSVQLVNAVTGNGVEAVALAASEQASAEAEARQKECDFILYTDLAALKPSAGKVGGMFGRAVGAVTGSERYESRVEFRLVPTAGDATRIELNASAKQEGAEASVGAALDAEAKAVVAAVRKKK
ncbi:MAG TPA: hypothetical protein VNZ44_03470 [Pyrinomonadaceae bacterium]|nr:hypothetical protein [Pyrinomonadaceae bacterium]